MKSSFVLHLDSLNVLDELTDEQAGVLFKAIKMERSGVEPPLDFAMKLAFLPFKNQFKRDDEKYRNVVDRNKTNGAKGGRPLKPNVIEKTQTVSKKPQKADSVSENENGNETRERKALPLIFEEEELQRRITNEEVEVKKFICATYNFREIDYPKIVAEFIGKKTSGVNELNKNYSEVVIQFKDWVAYHKDKSLKQYVVDQQRKIKTFN